MIRRYPAVSCACSAQHQEMPDSGPVPVVALMRCEAGKRSGRPMLLHPRVCRGLSTARIKNVTDIPDL